MELHLQGTTNKWNAKMWAKYLYSVDEGETWKEYTDSFVYGIATTLMAKTIQYKPTLWQRAIALLNYLKGKVYPYS